MTSRHLLGVCLVLSVVAIAPGRIAAGAGPVVVSIDAPLAPPEWALLERELLRTHKDACAEFFARYFDERGFLLCVERWGGDDGPDDAIENVNEWPILHALGASDDILAMYKKAWEGHLRQYTLAKTVDVPFARDGMYYKEFPVTFDWLHNGEGLTVFNLQGLSDPHDAAFQRRVRRYAGFYMNEDPGAPNYDPQHKIIRSMFNGSRGPLMRKSTGLDWAGDPIEVENRFSPGHGERTYQEMFDHFKDYNDIVGDQPLNLLATSLGVNAFMLENEPKYKVWVLEYVDAWRQRMIDNKGIIPSNIGLDGKIGSAAGGKWYGGVYGWGFSVVVPQTGKLAHRNQHFKGFIGFSNAYLLTGDDRYLDVWRTQIDTMNSLGKTIDGKLMYPTMYGDDGWYNYTPAKYTYNALELYYLSMKDEDRTRLPTSGWIAYLDGKNPRYPVQALRADLTRIRERAAAMRLDTTTPDTRLADDPMKYNPASVASLIELMLGGVHPHHNGAPLHCRVRYFDPAERRAGIPEGVAALVQRLSADELTLTLVNTDQLHERQVILQAGGYGEHQIVSATTAGKTVPVDARDLTVRLAPGAGAQLVLTMKRYANPPRLRFPWDIVRP